MASARVTPEEARAAVLAGRTVRIVVGSSPGDPTCLHYLDRCYEDFDKLMIYTESVAGWSAGVKEAICEPDEEFYVEFISDPAPLSLTVTDEVPPRREAQHPITWEADGA